MKVSVIQVVGLCWLMLDLAARGGFGAKPSQAAQLCVGNFGFWLDRCPLCSFTKGTLQSRTCLCCLMSIVPWPWGQPGSELAPVPLGPNARSWEDPKPVGGDSSCPSAAGCGAKLGSSQDTVLGKTLARLSPSPLPPPDVFGSLLHHLVCPWGFPEPSASGEDISLLPLKGLEIKQCPSALLLGCPSLAATEGEGRRHLACTSLRLQPGVKECPRDTRVICKQSKKQNMEREELL